MKVLHLIPTFSRGGSERILIDICENLRKEGIETKIIYFFEYADSYILEYDFNICLSKVHIQKSISKKSIVEIESYEKEVDDFQPDIIHSHSFFTDIISREHVRKDILYVSHFHLFIDEFKGFSPETLKSKKALTTYIDRQLLFYKYFKFNNSLFLTVSNKSDYFYKKVIHKRFHNHIFKLPNAVNLDRFKTKERVLLNNRNIVLITVGRLVKEKNHLFLLEVVELLKKKGFNVKLIILGSGPFKIQLQNEIKSKGLESEIEIPGAVDDVEAWLSRAHIYVHSSLSETFGISILEALASGLPCVVLDAEGNRELIIDGVNGYILGKAEVKVFTDKIIKILSSGALYSTMSKQARFHSTNYSFPVYMNLLMNIYKNGLKKVHLQK